MAGSNSKSAVAIAIVGNGFLTVVKFLAFSFSGSGAMLSESIHSLADTGNQALLFIGIRRSEAPANATFHYGLGAERYFYALMSAVGIFILGCGVTLYHGVQLFLVPHELNVGWLDFSVLGLALIVDGYVFLKAFKVVNEKRGKQSIGQFLRTSSDPTLAAVLLEDGIAILGVLIAGTGILASQSTGSHVPDAVATILIGLLLGGVAIWLGYKNRQLILGRAMPPEMQSEIVEFLRSQPTIERVAAIKSRIVGAETYKFAAEVDWDGSVIAERLMPWVDSQAERLVDPEQRREFVLEFGDMLTDAVAIEIDRVEAALRERFPGLTHLELEGDMD